MCPVTFLPTGYRHPVLLLFSSLPTEASLRECSCAIHYPRSIPRISRIRHGRDGAKDEPHKSTRQPCKAFVYVLLTYRQHSEEGRCVCVKSRYISRVMRYGICDGCVFPFHTILHNQPIMPLQEPVDSILLTITKKKNAAQIENSHLS